jgi:hypothetical protein
MKIFSQTCFLITLLTITCNYILFRLPEFQSIYFRAKEVRILFDFCTECNHTQKVYLQEFSKMDFSNFCLAHIFTYRDFPAGIQGLAWRNTTCHRRYNTGFTTFLNHQVGLKNS